ncbi:MAG TPA: HAD family hydrolase [Polaromonas sp.]|uniref:HAD family hydrolase n=1 Tax=Polaromonas sp. TaxID=1869339 RepID=UPI002D64F9B9|nr:HAD family hydrolase [Polaromonas sp.]HYW56876.1 HAD family hydrolase [Polaromonas sp.]
MPELETAQATGTIEVAAFDFDGTLTRGDTFLPYLQQGLGWPRFLLALVQSAPWLGAYAVGLMSNHRAKARLLKVSLGGRSLQETAQWSADFVARYLPGQWQKQTMDRLPEHQRLGHRCVMVSASPGIYLHQVGQLLKLDAVICTELEVDEGTLTGRMLTANCHGEEKVRRLKAWLAENVGQRPMVLHAYGDTQGDVPMLNLADCAWYRGQPWPRKP